MVMEDWMERQIWSIIHLMDVMDENGDIAHYNLMNLMININ